VNIGDDAGVRRRLVNRLNHVEPINHWRESLLQTRGCLSRPETAETEDWLRDAGGA